MKARSLKTVRFDGKESYYTILEVLSTFRGLNHKRQKEICAKLDIKLEKHNGKLSYTRKQLFDLLQEEGWALVPMKKTNNKMVQVWVNFRYAVEDY